ncbi:uncharacterized protein GGS25DRAFT_494151 [Hypoxylon fragiforme]|uniref:uncharacterized protein n=1 Tax=Hypoxylon fragiforme TaxID=63214 RepID=UPI0020C6911F|nr:uncharacterized protein GGS25DRAFT_494151 [Hypoxylon fragiforme]KAI2607038.1 hypothetical protein GGS25DRAFT_494151 [Hypoxylon fragiforme]
MSDDMDSKALETKDLENGDVASDPPPAPDESGNSTVSSATATKDPSEELPGLPLLNYRLMEHKKKLFLVGGMLLLEGSILPIVLYYPLWFDTTLRHGILFAIITSFFGIVSGLEFAHRSWRLIQKDDKYRPLDGKRWRFDFTHMTLSVGYTIMTGILIGASIPHDPLVRPLAIPLPLFFIQVGAMALFTGFMDVRHMSTTCKVSSRPKGVRMPPVLLVFIEDVVAVDGGAGKTYRERLWTRYRVSRVFRRLIRGLNWFWGVGSLLVGAGSLAVVWTVPEEIAYGIGWGAPLVLTIIWTAITVLWTHRSLKAEKESWMDDLKRQAQKRNGNEKPLRQ